MSVETLNNKSAGADISLRSATKRYGNDVALEGVDLDVRAGEFLTLLGPSGSGKTTTLNILAGFTDGWEGSLHVSGENFANVPTHKRNFGIVFQHYALFPHMTVRSNIEYPLRQRAIKRETRDQLVDQAMEMVALQGYGDRYPAQLSGGQQQRVAVARSIVFKPKLLLMDEPLGALDKNLRDKLQLELRRIHRLLGSTFVYVTHDQEEALFLSDRIAVFNRGRIEQIGTARELYETPASLFVGTFVGESTVLRGRAFGAGDCTHVMVADIPVTSSGSVQADQAAILVRPEDFVLTLKCETRPEWNGLPGTIRETVYLGTGFRYEVELLDGSTVKVRKDDFEPALSIGQSVFINWQKDNSILFPEKGS